MFKKNGKYHRIFSIYQRVKGTHNSGQIRLNNYEGRTFTEISSVTQK